MEFKPNSQTRSNCLRSFVNGKAFWFAESLKLKCKEFYRHLYQAHAVCMNFKAKMPMVNRIWLKLK